MSFASFNIELDGICENNYVEVYNGPSVTSPLVGRYCGTVSAHHLTAHIYNTVV